MRDRFAAPHRTFMASFLLCVKKLRRRRFQKARGINAFEDASVWEPSPGGRVGLEGRRNCRHLEPLRADRDVRLDLADLNSGLPVRPGHHPVKRHHHARDRAIV